MKHFINTGEFAPLVLDSIVERALASRGERSKALAGKSVALLFFNSSLRTRASFEVGVAQLGGHSTTLEVGSGVWNLEFRDGAVMDADRPEHIKDAARVLSRYFDAICVRSFPKLKDLAEDLTDPVVEALRAHSSVPVINLESCLYHPCQAMADMMTIRQLFGRTNRVKVALSWASHIKALPTAVPNSFAIAARQFGCDLTIVAPPEYPLPDVVMEQLGDVSVVHDQGVLAEQDVVYAKSWGSLLDYGAPPPEKYRDWIVDKAKCGNATFMHCMPLRRNVEIADDILDSPQNAIYDEAENRLHVQKEILKEVLTVTGLDVLREALPYIRRFEGQTFVVKFGGEIADDARRLGSFCEEIALCVEAGIKLVVVHGGGKQASALGARLGVEATIVNGRRVTDEETLDVVKMAFAGKLNTDVLAALRRAGVRGVGISGVDGGLLSARRRPPQTVVEGGATRRVDYGFVGDIVAVDTALLDTLAGGGFVPVVASLAADDEGAVYNVNADTVAARICAALKAEKWIVATSVDGVLDGEGRLVSRLTPATARAMIDDGTATGGMIPKLEAALAVLDAGTRSVHVINGTRPGALLDEVFTSDGSGTMIAG